MLLTEKTDGPRLLLLAAQLEGDLDRLETPLLLRRARRGGVAGPAGSRPAYRGPASRSRAPPGRSYLVRTRRWR